jgi:hypothetical protein
MTEGGVGVRHTNTLVKNRYGIYLGNRTPSLGGRMDPWTRKIMAPNSMQNAVSSLGYKTIKYLCYHFHILPCIRLQMLPKCLFRAHCFVDIFHPTLDS